MFNALRNLAIPQAVRSTRFFSQTTISHVAISPQASSTLLHHPYFVPRNSRGNLPVYTDVRNAGSRYLVLIRNIDGNTTLLAKELAETLFPLGSEEASRMKIEIIRSKNLVISGGHWKNHVMEWLKNKGF